MAWSDFFPFAPAQALTVTLRDRLVGLPLLKGTATVTVLDDTTLSLTVHIPEADLLGHTVPETRAGITLVHRRAGGGNAGTIDRAGTRVTDDDVTMEDGRAGRRIAFSHRLGNSDLGFTLRADGSDKARIEKIRGPGQAGKVVLILTAA